jgi:sRNA-binding protein
MRPGNWAVRVLSVSLTRMLGVTMSSKYRVERNRGTKEARQQLAVLREKWPLAFPANLQDVRPLAIGAPGEIAAEMSWSLPYTLGVLAGWKMAPAYCEAVLRYDQRVALDGSPAETIDAEAKELATKQLAQLAARETAKKATKAAPPAAVKPKPSTATPEQLRARVRASLSRRRA